MESTRLQSAAQAVPRNSGYAFTDSLDTRLASRDRETQRLKHKEIRERYRRKRKPFIFTDKRVEELQRLAHDRHGDTLPDNDEGRDFVFAIAAHLIEPKRIRRWLDEAAPWFDEDDADELVVRITRKRYRFRAAKLGQLLAVTWAEQTHLELDTITAIDTPPQVIAAARAQRRARQRERGRAWQERQRRKQGRKPRTQYEAESKSRTKPWEAEGMSRATWYRKNRETTVSITILTSGKRIDTPISSSRKPRRSRPTTTPRKHQNHESSVAKATVPSAPRLTLITSTPIVLITPLRPCNADDADRRLATAIMVASSTGPRHEAGRACS